MICYLCGSLWPYGGGCRGLSLSVPTCPCWMQVQVC